MKKCVNKIVLNKMGNCVYLGILKTTIVKTSDFK